jgi:hypothetical protein
VRLGLRRLAGEATRARAERAWRSAAARRAEASAWRGSPRKGGGPGAGSAWYYLGRAQNGCDGSYGDSGQVPDPRDALDAGTPCP